MHKPGWRWIAMAVLAAFCTPCLADDPATRPADAGVTDKLPYIHVDLKAKQVTVDCQALNVSIPLEFFCVTNGGNEHESVLRTPAKPSDIHFALLMLGLTPGSPATFSPATKMWIPPHGPPLHLTCKYMLNGRAMEVPAYRLMRGLDSKKEMPPAVWVFDGSRVMPDGVYAADVTGYVVSICNFDLTMIDVPALVSNANETLEWETNTDLVPPKGTAVTMVIEPAMASELPKTAGLPAEKFNPGPGLGGGGGLSAPPAGPAPAPDAPAPPAAPPVAPSSTQPGAAADPPGAADTQAEIDRLKLRWDQAVGARREDLRQAAQAHYEIIASLRQRQQHLIDQADEIQRTIDDLEKQYQELTTPQPAATTERATK